MSESQSRMNPLIATAAVALIIFSAVGVGVMTGLIPSSASKEAQVQVPARPEAARTETAPAQQKAASNAPRKTHVADTPKRAPASEPARIASAAPRACASCGTVEAVNVIEQQGEGSGLGAVAGGVAGALLGNQIGGGSGRKIATVAGAAGGAYAGHQIEKHVKTTKRYDVVVRMDAGGVRHFSYDAEPAFGPGEKVRVVDGRLVVD